MWHCCCLIKYDELENGLAWLDVMFLQPMNFSMYSHLVKEAGGKPPYILDDSIPQVVMTTEISTEPDGLLVAVFRGDE
jgi:hypothetical protein